MEKVAFDPARFKEQERKGFNFVANRYEDAAIGTLPARERLVILAELKEGMQVLDVATGPGLVARQAAALVGTTGSVIGVDIAEEALEVARQKATEEKLLQVSFEVADAEALQFADQSFDRVFCSQGLMHFAQAEKAAREFKRVLKLGGRLVASVLGEESLFPFITVATSNLARNLPPSLTERPSVFRYGKPEAFEQLIKEAGFEDVHIEPVTMKLIMPTAEFYWHTFLSAAGFVSVALTKLPPELQAHLEQDVEKDLRPYQTDSGYELDNTLLLVRANA